MDVFYYAIFSADVMVLTLCVILSCALVPRGFWRRLKWFKRNASTLLLSF